VVQGGAVGYLTGSGYSMREAAIDAGSGAVCLGVLRRLGTVARFAARNADEAAKTVRVSRSRYPQSARHIDDAQAAGQPAELTIDRAGAAARRREATSGTQRQSGLDRDEYPPAMMREGGQGSSVRLINPGDNRGAGACIGAQCRTLPDGTRVRIETVP
jgi:filamentous hemagglutinin